MPNYRHQHLESEILNILNHTVKFEIDDEYLKKCSFTNVRLTSDYSYIFVSVDTYDRSKIDQMIDRLTTAKGVFRTQLAQYLKIRKIPDIKFIKDKTIDNSQKIDDLLDKIK